MVKDGEALEGDFKNVEVLGLPSQQSETIRKMYQTLHSFSRLHDKLHLIFQSSRILK